MLVRNLFDEAARLLAMPIPRRKALKYLATGFVAAMLPFVWPKEATAIDRDFFVMKIAHIVPPLVVAAAGLWTTLAR
jgi:hypothetical protein